MNIRRRHIQKARRRAEKIAAADARAATPTACNHDVYERGELMFLTHSIGRSAAIERWVQKIARVSGQPVDWHFSGGRVLVKALGNLAAVRSAIRSLIHEHDAAFLKSHADLGFSSARVTPPRPSWWSNDEASEPDTSPRIVECGGTLVLVDPQAYAIVAALNASA